MPPKQKQKQKQQQSTKVVVNIGEQKKRRVVRRKKPSDSKQQPPQAPPRPPTSGGFPSFAPFSPIYQPPRQVYMGQPAYAEPLVAQSGRPVMTDVERQRAGREAFISQLPQLPFLPPSNSQLPNVPEQPAPIQEPVIKIEEPLVKREEPFRLPRFEVPIDFGRVIRGEPQMPPLEQGPPPMFDLENEFPEAEPYQPKQVYTREEIERADEEDRMREMLRQEGERRFQIENPEAFAKREARRLAREEKERERQARYGRFNN